MTETRIATSSGLHTTLSKSRSLVQLQPDRDVRSVKLSHVAVQYRSVDPVRPSLPPLSPFMKVYTDAATGDAVVGVGWYIVPRRAAPIEGTTWLDGDYTSMEGEYFAMLHGTRAAKRVGRDEISLLSDCEPLVCKMQSPDYGNDVWRRRRNGLQRLLDKFTTSNVEWIARSNNQRADRLAHTALERGRTSKDL